jgi:DNA-binding response OmpR family regulator
MTSGPNEIFAILVVEDAEETRHGIMRLLRASGYEAIGAEGEEEAVLKAVLQPCNLILISPGADSGHAAEVGMRIRERAGLGEKVPIVIFCVPELAEGAEVAAANNVYMTRPDNFNQLRTLLGRLLQTPEQTS